MIRCLVLALALLLSTPALADTLIDNVNGISVERDGSVRRFAAMVIDDAGRIVQLVDRRGDAPRTDYREDGRGRTVIPGMIDSHAHVMGLGLSLLSLDLSDTRSLAEAQAKIAAYAAENPDRPWIIGRGWNQETWGLGRFPTAAELDAVVADRPVWLERVDGHAGWANSLALSPPVPASGPRSRGGRHRARTRADRSLSHTCGGRRQRRPRSRWVSRRSARAPDPSRRRTTRCATRARHPARR
jgi:predicted amidohydrolase YtcJ